MHLMWQYPLSEKRFQYYIDILEQLTAKFLHFSHFFVWEIVSVWPSYIVRDNMNVSELGVSF